MKHYNVSNISIDNNSEDFISRVMKENLWTRFFTLRVIQEYKKFLWMSTISEVSPSYEIDQVWHTHILYTKDYEKVSNLLAGKFIHHNPTSSKDKLLKGISPYINTKELYEKYFGIPPKDIWTDFKPSQYTTIDIKNYWLTPVGDWKALIKILFKHLKFKINGIF